MEIPLEAQVECNDGLCGTAVYVLINPVAEQVTHVVVKTAPEAAEYLVPLDLITETIAGLIRLRCSRAELAKLDPFVKTEYVEERVDTLYLGSMREGGYSPGMYYYWPYVSPAGTVSVPVARQQIPAGERALRRGTQIAATDGVVGHVDEFVVDGPSGAITHLVMREGHLWGQKEVILPLSAVGDVQGDTISLKLNKRQIEALPTFPLQRHWA